MGIFTGDDLGMFLGWHLEEKICIANAGCISSARGSMMYLQFCQRFAQPESRSVRWPKISMLSDGSG